MKDKGERITNVTQANEKVVALYSAYYFEHIQRVEPASRRKAFLGILLQIATKLYGPDTGMSLGFKLLEASMQPLEEAEEGEYRKG